jgi:hypothetical protein
MHFEYFGFNDDGRHLFRIEVFQWDEENELFDLTSSLPEFVFELAEIKPLVINLLQQRLSLVQRNAIANELIERIKSLPRLKRFYFKDDQLDRNGHYQVGYAELVDAIVDETEIEAFVPYSKNSKPHVLNRLSAIIGKLHPLNFVTLSRMQFETMLMPRFDLQQEYVEVYSSEAKFQKYCKQNTGEEKSFVLMTVDNEIKLVFFIDESDV